MIPTNEVALIFRGWAESKLRLRVIFKGSEIIFSAYCTVFKANDGSVVFAVSGDETNLIEFLLVGCACEFTDAEEGEDTLPFGGTIESAIVVGRPGYALTVCLLKDEA